MMAKIFTPWVVKFFTPLLQLLAVAIIILTSTQIYYPIFDILGQDNFARYAAFGVTFFIYGGVVFVATDLFVNFLERSKKLSVLDHVRQSAFLYLLLGCYLSVFLRDNTWVEMIQSVAQMVMPFIIACIFLYGIVVDAIFLYIFQKWAPITKFRIFRSVFIGLVILFVLILGLDLINKKTEQSQNPGMNISIPLPSSFANPVPVPRPTN